MNLMDFQQALFIAFNPILLLLLGLYFAVHVVEALGSNLQGAADYVRDRWRRR